MKREGGKVTLEELKPLLPEGAEIFGLEPDSRYIIRLPKGREMMAEGLANACHLLDIKALVVVSDELAIYRVQE